MLANPALRMSFFTLTSLRLYP
ncbi:MAG: hypothetical protein QOC69_1241, partial [Mycobacterium sp.]|nr:hypothetical protein [Mycobacterium sp.]